MKNKIVAGGLAILTAFALMACGTNNPGDGNSADTETSESVAPVQEAWTDEQKQIMQDHLDGNILPFMAIPGMNVQWYEEYGCVSIEATEGNDTLITGYKDLLVGDGFTMAFDSEQSSWGGSKDLGSYKMLSASIYTSDTMGFICDIYLDVPVQNWPTDLIATFLGTGAATVPAHQADNYYIYDLSASYGCFEVVALGQATGADTAYGTTLTNAGWTVDTTYLADYGVYVATDANQTVEVNYYLNGTALVIDIYSLAE